MITHRKWYHRYQDNQTVKIHLYKETNKKPNKNLQQNKYKNIIQNWQQLLNIIIQNIKSKTHYQMEYIKLDTQIANKCFAGQTKTINEMLFGTFKCFCKPNI